MRCGGYGGWVFGEELDVVACLGEEEEDPMSNVSGVVRGVKREGGGDQ